ncbi:MAG: hypothetical protein IKR57_05660 [Bacilli bacterium]|nr:hypothetical protein [Bacilli bacterium]
MTKANIIILIIAILVVLVLLCIILYKTYGEKLDNIVNKLKDSEKDAIDKLNNKKEILLKLIDFTESKYKIESKVFEEVKKLNIEDLSSFNNEKTLNKAYKEVVQIREDHKKVRELKAYKELFIEYDKNEINIISLRTFHNKYTLIYNNMLKKFPYNIISKFKKYKLNSLIEGKELENNYNNDLEV